MSNEKNKVKDKNVIGKATDAVMNSIEAILPATIKVGAVVNRVATMDKAGVDHEVIALQMTKKSTRGKTYEKTEISTIVKLYEDCKTRVPLSAKSARALIKTQGKRKGECSR